MTFWENKNVLVTGGAGFIGSHLTEALYEKKANVTIVGYKNVEKEVIQNLLTIRKKIKIIKADLTKMASCIKATKGQDIVMNIAGVTGGIHYNNTHPGTLFRDNVLLNTNMLESARIENVERFLVMSSACVYPRFVPIPTPETEGFKDMPEPTNFGYGWSKRIAEIQAMCYAQEFGMKIGIARPYNTYGPRDCFKPEKSHVIAALISKIFEADKKLEVWGSGNQSRSFLYVKDCAEGLLKIVEKYPKPDPINIGTDEEIKIKDLAELIIKLSGKPLKIMFDSSKPDGQPRRNCDITKSKEKLGFVSKTRLEEGLKETIDWYRKNI